MADYRFRATVWRHSGGAAWHFATLPFEIADDVEQLAAPHRRGFGSVPVRVTIGTTTWDTSLFPDSAAESYVLPVKKPVRDREGLTDGDVADIHLTLVDLGD